LLFDFVELLLFVLFDFIAHLSSYPPNNLQRVTGMYLRCGHNFLFFFSILDLITHCLILLFVNICKLMNTLILYGE
jgi:uncharacterized protein YqhQ